MQMPVPTVPVVLHDQKVLIAPHLSCLDPTNVMMSLMTLLVNTDASTNGITCPKIHVAPDFDCLNIMNAMFAIENTIGVM